MDAVPLTFRIDTHLSRLIEQARHEPFKAAIRCLKKARRGIKREIRRRRKHKNRASSSARDLKKMVKMYSTGTLKHHGTPVHPGGAEAQPPQSFGINFRPPDPGVVRQIMADGGYPVAEAAPQSPECDDEPAESDTDDEGVLILPAKEQVPQEAAPVAVELPPMDGIDMACSEDGTPADLPTP